MPIQRRPAALAAAAIVLGAASAQAEPSDHAEVTQAVAALTRAMIAVDVPRLEALASDHLSYGHSGGKVEDKAQFIANLVSRANAFRRIDLGDETVIITAGDAIARHLFTGETVSPAGQATPVRIGVLQVWRKEAGHWRLLARQAYRI